MSSQEFACLHTFAVLHASVNCRRWRCDFVSPCVRARAGFGVVFDTFRNSELNHIHKDIALYVNDGTTLDPSKLTTVIGCDADFRFWEGRDDFSVSNKSVAKITFSVRSSCCG